MQNRVRVALFVAITLLVPAAARAQAGVPLSQLLVHVLFDRITLDAGTHQAHFSEPDNSEVAVIFNQAIVSQFATFPTGSSSGGFSYTKDPTLGTTKRSTESFGPSFAERALTAGRSTVTFGMNFQYSQYDHFNSIDMRNGDLKFYLRHDPLQGQIFTKDLIQADTKLKLSTQTVSFFLNYGVTDRLDLSVVVPLVHASMDVTADATILRLATAGTTLHHFPNGTTQETFSEGGTATGIGDLLIRGKYLLMAKPGGGLAVEVDARLPTGDADNLLGLGASQTTFMVIGSGTHGRYAPHFNVGYTVSGESDVLGSVPDEVLYRGGLEFVVNPKLTLAGDIVGRSQLSAQKLDLGTTVYPYTDVNLVPQTTSFSEFQQSTGTLNIVLAAVGGKYNISGNCLLTANVLFPINWTGMRARITPVVGFEYSFGGRTK